ncbi:MAG: hypothetical protein AAAB35_09465 [Phyllobacterium sp.]|uniref:hypothetical protein n=1 Tax=Phyllobacterium sp. TaxID=1871046 RepID=UPI0030F13067
MSIRHLTLAAAACLSAVVLSGCVETTGPYYGGYGGYGGYYGTTVYSGFYDGPGYDPYRYDRYRYDRYRYDRYRYDRYRYDGNRNNHRYVNNSDNNRYVNNSDNNRPNVNPPPDTRPPSNDGYRQQKVYLPRRGDAYMGGSGRSHQ